MERNELETAREGAGRACAASQCWQVLDEHQGTVRPALGLAGLAALWGGCVALPAVLMHVPSGAGARVAPSWLVFLAEHRFQVSETACWIAAVCALCVVVWAAERTGYWQFLRDPRESRWRATRTLAGMGLAVALAGASLAPVVPSLMLALHHSVFQDVVVLVATLFSSMAVVPVLLAVAAVYVAGSLRGFSAEQQVRWCGSLALLGSIFQQVFLKTAVVTFPLVATQHSFFTGNGHDVVSFVVHSALAGLVLGALAGYHATRSDG